MTTFFAKLPYQITGDSYEQLKKYDANSRKKINILGWFAIIPTFLWFVSAYLLCSQVLKTGSGIAMLAGAVAAALIFLFERSIVQSKKTNSFLVSIRLLLGLLIAAFSSVVLDLVIFENDIAHFAKTQFLKGQETKLTAASVNLQSANEIFNKEMEGKSGSNQKGFGRIAKEKKEQVALAGSEVAEAKSKLAETNAVLADPYSPAYQQIKDQLGLDTILNRVKLLHEFVMQNGLAFTAWMVLLLIGILLEVFGVLTKCFYPQSAYEADVEAMETMLGNKRRQALEQSAYYTGLGVHGRQATALMAGNRAQVLN